jgi:predicted DNA-binding transcriptional regulator YafY
MSTDEALTFKLAEMFLEPLLPPSVRLRLSGYFDLADKRLKESKFEHWVEKVSIVPSNLSLVPAEIEPNLLAVVYESLLKQKRFKANYQPIDRKEKSYEMNPLGLVFKNNIIYLVATVFEYTDVKQFALHRFRSAELIDKSANSPENFNLKSYIDKGGFDYPIDNIFGKIEIKLRINRFIKQLLTETPLDINQHISEFNDGIYILNATVKDTEQLRWWIRSFGIGIEVLEPLSLREEFAEEIRTLSSMYS